MESKLLLDVEVSLGDIDLVVKSPSVANPLSVLTLEIDLPVELGLLEKVQLSTSVSA